MTTVGEEIFWTNANLVLRDIGMTHLDPAHGAAVDIVRWCLNTHSRPTHHRQEFLEAESPQLLAYLETLAKSGDSAAWYALKERIRERAELLGEAGHPDCARPWIAAIWHALPELVAFGQAILDEHKPPLPISEFKVSQPSESTETTGGDGGDKGSGKTGSAGTTAAPRPSPRRLVLPKAAVDIEMTQVEKRALQKTKDAEEAAKDETAEGPDGTDGPGGMKGPGGKR
ncbi:hypothetical protein ACC778_08300 [Rhizobium ruizarguesonis]